jgi:hypothetical protein
MMGIALLITARARADADQPSDWFSKQLFLDDYLVAEQKNLVRGSIRRRSSRESVLCRGRVGGQARDVVWVGVAG